jgi:pimeloyl-ACP methyl ester carboxylesterase
MRLRPTPIFEVVRLIDLQPQGETGFCMLVTLPSAAGPFNELRDELDVQAGKSLGALDVHDLTAAELVEQVPAKQGSVILIHGFETWHDAQFVSLDVNRSRLETGAFMVFTVDPRAAGRFLNHAPNIRSFLGANIFAIGPDP